MSSSVYWVAAAAIVDKARVVLAHSEVSESLQPDLDCVLALEVAGGHYDLSRDGRNLSVYGTSRLRGIHKNAKFMPDGAMALAVIAAFATSRSRLTGLRTLRVKETDRIAALASELRKVGCRIETGEDWIEITPPDGGVAPADGMEPRGEQEVVQRGSRQERRVPRHPGVEPVVMETYNDHRMAMAFAVLGLMRPGISIRNPACVSKSYPGFWKDFAKLYQ